MLPLLVGVTIVLAWALTLGVSQVRLVDAARETARAVARGESETVATGLGRRIAPDGAAVEIGEHSGWVRVRVTLQTTGPAGLPFSVPAPRLTAEAVAVREGPP